MSDLVSFNQANLPTVTSLSTALRALEKDVAPVGVTILKMDKTGHWVYGADQTEIEDNSLWAVNPFSFIHGFIAWGDGEVLGEKMVSVSQPLPEIDTAPDAAKRGWETQVGLSLKCISGEDKGLEARFSTTSVGGKRAVQALAVLIANQVEADQTKPVPIITLQKEHYQHKSYGRIFTPVFQLVEWVGMDANASTEEVEETLPDGTTVRRRRATA
jgi:hypothetical protein